MPDTVETRSTLEDEFEQLQAAEAKLEKRAAQMWNAEIVALVVAFIALVVGFGALALAVIANNNNGSTTVMMRGASGSTATPGTARNSGAGMMGGSATKSPVAVNAARTINVQLGEMFARPDRTTISAGKVTFVARNVGMLTHELMVEKAPIKMDTPGHPNEKAALGMINDMGHMGTGRMTLNLTPGTYVLFCNVPGHYAAGQHSLLTVTK